MHREHGGGSGNPKRAPRHAELALIDRGARIDLDPVVELLHGGTKLKCHPLACREELPMYLEVAVIAVADLARDEVDIGVSFCVEEVGSAEVLVTLAVAGVYARGVDDQLEATGALVVHPSKPLMRSKWPLTFSSPQKCGTRNSAVEWAGSTTQVVVVLMVISLSVVGGL